MKPVADISGANTARGRDRALVLGGSFAGLLAARVLSEFFHEVVVLEQDAISTETLYHRGVPQARHLHGLLARGAAALEELIRDCALS